METNENTCFKRLKTIAAAIVEEAKALLNRNPTAVMQTRPAQAALFEGRSRQLYLMATMCESKCSRVVNSEFSARYGKPLACLHERTVALACDHAGIEEYKLKDTWEDENELATTISRITRKSSGMQDAAPRQPFLHNFYHDVESLWRISVHSLFATEPPTTERDQNARRKQKVHSKNLFPNWSPRCSNFLEAQSSAYTDITSCLPNEFEAVAAPLAQSSMALNKAVTGAITGVRPFQLEDQLIYEGKTADKVDEEEISNDGCGTKLRRTGRHIDTSTDGQGGSTRGRSTRSDPRAIKSIGNQSIKKTKKAWHQVLVS
ncbi:hypothetical protein EDD85DRAFT_788652 [Armillaria nabsnona]|nr:hypothetical protein EDD85DRAFT_788652 [Armillaria nabsnona]